MSGQSSARRQTKTTDAAREAQRKWNEVVEQALLDLDLESEEEDWKWPFLVTRRIHKSVLEHGGHPKEYRAEFFADAIESAFPNEDMLVRVMGVWEMVVYPEDYAPIEYAVALAKRSKWRAPMPDTIPETLRDKAALLASVIKYFQDLVGADVFLSSRDAARVLDSDSSATGAGYLKLLVDHGVIKEVKPADRAKRHAATFRYQGRLNT